MAFFSRKHRESALREPRDGAILIGFLFFNAVFRLALIRVNGGEYTDGILQIVQFDLERTFWPPLYPALIYVLRAAGIDPIMAGRLISWAASVLLVLPLWSVARAWAGRRAALFALVLYSASPSALRWSIRVMTDMPFALLFYAACAGVLRNWTDRTDRSNRAYPSDRSYEAWEPGPNETPGGKRASGAGWVVWTTLAAVAATMTRYQGLLLAPLTLWAAFGAWRARAKGRGSAAAVQIAWLALPAWLVFRRFGHVEQIVDRASSAGTLSTVLNYWYYFEMFLCLTPYVLTLPVFVFLVVGIVKGPGSADERRAEEMNAEGKNGEGESVPHPQVPLLGLFLYAALAVLCAQSVFQSFQSRYLLPLVPFALTCAGAGMARAERFLTDKGRAARAALFAAVGLTVCWSMGFALASVVLQREAFKDIYDAGRRIREMNLPPDARVYSNETYAHADGVKLAFASGRSVTRIPELAGDPEPMPAGSIVAVHTAYGGPYASASLVRALQGRYELTPVEHGRFASTLVPLLPDIMEEPQTHQNPLAWLLRYRLQHFETSLFRVVRRVESRGE